MKCPKCHYVSHDYLDACRKCGIDLVTFKQDIGLLVLQPGVLDLSLVLGGAGADDLFESVEEEVSMHASDEEFDISLDDYAEHPGVRRASTGVSRLVRPESGTEITGMDHLTLELDSSDLPPEMTARLRAARVIADEPPTVPMQPPAEPGATTLPRHVTFDMTPESITHDFPTTVGHNMVASEPGSRQAAPEPQAMPDVPSLQCDVRPVDLACLTPADALEAASIDEPGAESVSAAMSMADSSGNLVSLPLQDVVLAEEPSIASGQHTSEVVESILPTLALRDVPAASAQTDAARCSATEVTAEAAGLVRKSPEGALAEALLPLEADQSSESARAEVGEPTIRPRDEPPRETLELQSSLTHAPSTHTATEATLSDLAAPTLDELPFMSADVSMPRPPSIMEEITTAEETPPESLLTSSDMFALENLEDPRPPEHLTLELEPPVLPSDLASTPLAAAVPTLLTAPPERPETLTSAAPEPDLPVVEALTFEDLDDIALPAHLTLELDNAAIAAEVASIPLDDLQLDNPPRATQAPLSPRDAQIDDEEGLLLDLDDVELDDEESA